MKDKGKTKEQLIQELTKMRQRVAELEAPGTGHKRTEEALRESEERFHKIFDHSNDAILIIDPAQDEILDVNSMACRMLGYSREELLSLPISAVHPEEMPRLREFAQSVFEHGQGWTDELTCFTKSEEALPSEISASVIDIGGRVCIIALVRDITQRKQAEEAVREAERLRALTETAGAAAHEINQPLTVVVALTQILLSNMSPDDPKRSNIESIHKAGQRISNIVRKMGDIRRYATKPYASKTNIVDFDKAARNEEQEERE